MKEDRFVAASLAVLSIFFLIITRNTGIENAFIFFTGPWCIATETNPISGFAFQFVNGDIYHNENTSILVDQAMFAGHMQNQSFYALRPGIGFLAFLLFPFLKPTLAAQATLWILATLVLLAGYFLARRNGDSRLHAALWGCMLFSLSCVMFHVNDLSAHLGGAALWTINLLLLVSLRPWQPETPISHIILTHCILIFSTFFYAINIIVYFAFVIITILNTRIFIFNSSVFIFGLATRSIWPWLMNSVYGGDIDYGKVERLQFLSTMKQWSTIWDHDGIQGIFARALEIAIELITSEPLSAALLFVFFVVLILQVAKYGVRETIFYSDRVYIFLLACLGGAILGGLIWGPGIAYRGYISYGIPITLIFLIIISFNSLEYRRKKIQILALAALLSVVSFQQIWSKSHLLGNPIPACHYAFPRASLTKTFGEFKRGFWDKLQFVPLQNDLGPGSVPKLASALRQEARSISEIVSGSTIAAVGDHSGLWRSFVLAFFLLAPVTVAAAIGARMIRPAWSWRRCAAVACLTMGLLWFQAWAIAPIGKSEGERFRFLTFRCDSPTQEVDYRIALSSKHVQLIKELRITDIMVRSGWQIANRFELEHTKIYPKKSTIEKDPYIIHNLNQTSALIPVSEIEKFLDEDSGRIEFRVKERYRKPIVQYFGWQRAKSRPEERIITSCSKGVLPAVEVRGFKNGQRTSRLYFY